jgi:hypothetical protein
VTRSHVRSNDSGNGAVTPISLDDDIRREILSFMGRPLHAPIATQCFRFMARAVPLSSSNLPVLGTLITPGQYIYNVPYEAVVV